MMKHVRSIAIVLLFVLILLAGSSPGQRASTVEHLIMISIDGLVPEYYLTPAKFGLKLPNLISMKLRGAYADGVEGVFPSVTYPSHTTMVTGVRPATHGIIQNRIFEAPTDPQTRSWYWFADAIRSETIWDAAKKAGLRTGAVGWPVTAKANIDYNVPEIWDPGEDPPSPKRMLEYSTPGLLAKAMASKLANLPRGDEFRTQMSEYIIKEHKPNLLLVHLIELDGAHHRNGPRSREALEVAEQMDSFVGRIVEAARQAGILDQTAFLIVSDHGFAEVNKTFEPNVVLVREGLIRLGEGGKPIDWRAAAWTAGGSCAIILRDPKDREAAAKVARIFSRIASRQNSPINRVLSRRELDRLGAFPGAELALDAAPGYYFGDALTGPEVHDPGQRLRGTHGQLPTRAELRASLIMSGRGVRAGARVPLARMIDIAPTAAALLGLKLSKPEGRPIFELLVAGSR